MKFSVWILAAFAMATASAQCEMKELEMPMEMSLEGFALRFMGLTPSVVSRVEGSPMVRILGYNMEEPPVMSVEGDAVMIKSSTCMATDSTPLGTIAPSIGEDVEVGSTEAPASSASLRSVATSVTMMVGSYLLGVSPPVAVGLSALTAMTLNAPMAAAHESSECEQIVEIEVRGPAPDADTEELLSQIEMLTVQLNNTVTLEEAEMMQFSILVDNFAKQDFVSASLPVDQTLDKLDSSSVAQRYDVAGFPIYNSHSPEAAFHLPHADVDSGVRDMQGDVFKFPTESNEPQDVNFTLPPPPAYTGPSDLIFMPILEIAALLRSGAVDCTTIVQTFIDRLDQFDPYLAIVSSTLYESALETAASHQALLDGGTDVGPLMCIPFGVKDHHQIFDDDITSYGHILYRQNVQSTKSTLMQKLMDGGAIPIAKMVLGTYAWGSTHGHGQCMSPYLNGAGGGSSCGSGSGAALGALPFAISEETSGSIASPAYANLISGHIGSYGTISRTGAGLLCSETDHLGFHSRYISDYGAIFNYVRTGADPMDGDSLSIPYVNPADVNVSSLRVMLIDGSGQWVYNATEDDWDWEGDIPQSRSKSGWHWDVRSQRIKDALDAAGVQYDTFTLDEAGALWSFNESTPYFDCASPDIGTMMGGGPWAKAQDFEYGFQNSKWTGVSNVLKKDYRYMQYCMVQMGKNFLNDQVWATYDVIIDTHTSAGGGYPNPGGSFEQWVRTAKTFVVDYMETVPCMHESGAATESAMTTLTAKPFEDYKNFAIGALIQDPANLVFPNDEAIMSTFGNRSRCALEFFEGFTNFTEACPAINGEGAPPYPDANDPDDGCDPESRNLHMNEGWREEPYEAPYLMDDPMPERALWRWDEYGPVACHTICPFVQSFCDAKGIVCDEDRMEQETSVMRSGERRRRRLTVEDHVRKLKEMQEDFAADEH